MVILVVAFYWNMRKLIHDGIVWHERQLGNKKTSGWGDEYHPFVHMMALDRDINVVITHTHMLRWLWVTGDGGRTSVIPQVLMLADGIQGNVCRNEFSGCFSGLRYWITGENHYCLVTPAIRNCFLPQSFLNSNQLFLKQCILFRRNYMTCFNFNVLFVLCDQKMKIPRNWYCITASDVAQRNRSYFKSIRIIRNAYHLTYIKNQPLK